MDGEALQRAAHSLKGSVSNFGAEGVYQAAFALEKLGRNGDLSGVLTCIDTLEHSLRTIHPALQELAEESA
jgi:HPt (histidine-containing phosphotransfer) domain-containing protein